MTTNLKPGDIVRDDEHGYGIVHRHRDDCITPGLCITYCKPGDGNPMWGRAYGPDFPGWERVETLFVGHVAVRVDDLHDKRFPNEVLGKRAREAWRAWAEQQVESHKEPAQPETVAEGDAPKLTPGQRYLDRQGDVWEVNADGSLTEKPEVGDDGLHLPLDRVMKKYGPLTLINDEERDSAAAQELPMVGDGCECWVMPEHTWTTHYGAVEPGSQTEYNPFCPKHGNLTGSSADASVVTMPEPPSSCRVELACDLCDEPLIAHVAREERTGGRIRGVRLTGVDTHRHDLDQPAQPDEPQEFGARVMVDVGEGRKSRFVRVDAEDVTNRKPWISDKMLPRDWDELLATGTVTLGWGEDQ